MFMLVPLCAIVLAHCVDAQLNIIPVANVAASTGAVSEAPVMPTASAMNETAQATNTTADCLWDGSVSEYLQCQRQTISTGTLIGAGLGVTAAILLLVGLCVWMCNRKRGRRPRTSPDREAQAKTADEGSLRDPAEADAQTTYDARNRGMHEKRRPQRSDRFVPQEKYYPTRFDEKRPHVEDRRDPRAARVESSSSAEYAVTPPPPHPAHVPQAKLPSEILGSPTDNYGNRQLYPSNPSPTPRHLAQPALIASRASTYSKRQSVVSARGPHEAGLAPPMPAPVRAATTGTPPLTIRKSAVVPSGRGAGGIPSYYEATRGQTGAEGVRPSLSMYGRAGSSPEQLPPLPIGSRPGLEARRPSEPVPKSRSVEGPKRGSAERGGMI